MPADYSHLRLEVRIGVLPQGYEGPVVLHRLRGVAGTGEELA